MKKFHCVDCNMDLSLVRIHQLQQSIHYRCLCLTVFGVFNFINRGMCEDVSWYGVKVQPHLERDSILVMCMWMNEIKINMADLNKINNCLTFFDLRTLSYTCTHINKAKVDTLTHSHLIARHLFAFRISLLLWWYYNTQTHSHTIEKWTEKNCVRIISL